MQRSLAFILMAGFLVAADDPRRDLTKQRFQIRYPDEKMLQGTWVTASHESSGRKLPAREGAKLVFKDDKWLEPGPPATRFRLDPTKKPKWIDLILADREAKLWGAPSVPGIYSLEGAELRICLVWPGDERPTEFVSKAGSNACVIIFKREKP
jgi:uncharacterized protein (TIGR03067 family)